MLVEKKGTPRCALVEPSTGSMTARRPSPPAPVVPDSSESTARPAPCSTGSAAPSAARSSRYWPGRVPAGPQSSRSSSAWRTGSHGLVEHCEQPNLVHEDRTLSAMGRAPAR